jgi:hypothetical protein
MLGLTGYTGVAIACWRFTAAKSVRKKTGKATATLAVEFVSSGNYRASSNKTSWWFGA